MARPTNDPKTSRLDLRMSPGFLKMIDEWRRREPDIPPRAEAIRRLIERGFFRDSWKKKALWLMDEWIKLADKAGISEDQKREFIRSIELIRTDEDRFSHHLTEIENNGAN